MSGNSFPPKIGSLSRPKLTIVFVVISILILSTGIILLQNQIKSSRDNIAHNNHQLILIKDIRSQMATLTMWQYTLRSSKEYDQKHALRELEETTAKMDSLAKELHANTNIDTIYTQRLNIALSQLKSANSQIIDANREYLPSFTIDSLTIDYRSLFNIASFHVNTVEDLLVELSKELSETRYIHLVRNISFGLGALIVIAIIIFTLIIARHEAEASLDEAESYLSDLFESMPSALIGINGKGEVVRLNKVAEALSVSTITEEPQAFDTIFPFLKPFKEEIEKRIQNREEFSFEYKSDTSQLIRGNLFPMGHSAHAGAVLRLEDITIEDHLKDELNQTKKMNAIGQLAGGVAHDFNNMLGGIMNATELLKLGCSPEEQELFLELIDNTTQRASELTQKLLTFAKKSVHKSEPLNINELLKSTTDLLSHTLDKRIDIVLNLPEENATILGDKGQVQNIFLNMGINSGQAMPEGGTLLYESSIMNFDEEYCRNSCFNLKPGRHIVIEVIDNGMGISPDNLEHIFEPFFTTKGSGTGIGLASAYGTIQVLGGEILVQSTLHTGTTFKVSLPLIESTDAPPVQHHNKPISGTGTILVVDDEVILRKSMELILNRLGYSVILAQNGLEGVEKFRENQSEIDLIILDMIMPVMKGDQAMVKIREISPTIPVLICSGYSHSNDIKKVKELSIQGIIPKPYQVPELSKIIASIIGENTPKKSDTMDTKG